MYLQNKQNGDLVEILDIRSLVDPSKNQIAGRYHAGEEIQDPENFTKSDLLFPSGEALPQCWTNPAYRD